MSRRRRRGRTGEHVNLERWLVSYADLMTLMFAFFVIMYAISKTDAGKFKAVSEGFKKSFGANAAKSENPSADTPQKQGGQSVTSPIQSEAGLRDERKRLADQVENDLRSRFAQDELTSKIEISPAGQGVLLRLLAQDFYEPGEPQVRTLAQHSLETLAASLKLELSRPGTRLRVEGHTDSSKISSPDFASNWELSAARAAWLVRYLIERHGLSPSQLEVAGYADAKPIADNATAEGRARNRRVELLVVF